MRLFRLRSVYTPGSGFSGARKGLLMTAFSRLVTFAIAGAISAPLAAQYYPQPGYPGNPGYPGYQYPGSQYPNQPYGYGQDAIGQMIDQLLGNRYNVSDRQAVHQCARAAVNQARYEYRGGGYDPRYGYNQAPGYDPRYGYNQGIARPSMRVTAITEVQRRSYGVRVRGLLDTGYSAQPYGYQNRGYGYGDLNFRCDVDYRGTVTNVRVNRNDSYRRY